MSLSERKRLYPRMRGADTVTVLSGVLDVPLLPRARGWHRRHRPPAAPLPSTPAYAGLTDSYSFTDDIGKPLPPHTRGRHRAGGEAGAIRASTPAYAGLTRS